MATWQHAVTASSSAELKRRQIVEAARLVLARDGLAGCTARAVADASPLTKSAIHYYFRDIDEIIDEAVAAHLGAMLESLREVVRDRTTPDDRLRAALRAYLDTFADKPHAAYLWFEYWVAVGRRGNGAAIASMLADVDAFLADLLPGTAPLGARDVLSWLLGTVVQQQARPRSGAELDAEIDRLVVLLGGQSAGVK